MSAKKKSPGAPSLSRFVRQGGVFDFRFLTFVLDFGF